MRILLFLVAHSGARTWRHACMVRVVAAAILTDCSSRKQNTFFDYDYAFPPKGSNLRKRPCRARDGVECYLCTVMLSIASQSIYTSVEPFNTEITSVSLL